MRERLAISLARAAAQETPARGLASFKLTKLEKMPVRREPTRLEELGRRRVCKDLDGTCRRLETLSLGSSCERILKYAKRTLRPYYVDSLPGSIRRRIIDETSAMLCERGNNGSSLFSGPTPLYLLALLLGPDIKQLRINVCCYYGCSHQTDMLRLLASEGIGIESLDIARTALLRLDCKLLSSALGNMRNLRSLTMRNIASDAILSVVGLSCPRLVVLDVACSKQVTDVGIERLLMRCQVTVQTEQIKMTNNIMASKYRRNKKNRSTTWSRVKALMAKLRLKNDEKKRERNNEREDGFLFEFIERRNVICESLKVINVAKTNVSGAGVFVILSNAINLESLAEYDNIDSVLEIMNRVDGDFVASTNREINGETLKLTQARTSGTTRKRLKILANACPRLEKLSIYEPNHRPEALRPFRSLTSLSVDGAPANANWIRAFYDYLRADGDNLRELYLRIRFDDNVETSAIDLPEILVSCPNLVTLTVTGSRVEWRDRPDDDPTRPFLRLNKIQISENVSAEAIVKIFTLAPELTSLHVHSCNQLTDQHIDTLLTPAKTSNEHNFNNNVLTNLTCFYVYEAAKLSLAGLVNFLERCENLRHIGNLANWGLKPEDMRIVGDMIEKYNADIEVCPVSHWFSNTCCSN